MLNVFSKMKGRSRLPHLITVLMWAAIGMVVAVTQDLPFESEGAPGPRFMPLMLVACLGILSIFYWLEAMFLRKDADLVLPKARELVRPAGFVALMVLIILLWERLGVIPTVLLAAFLELKFLDGYSWGKSALVGLFVSLLFWALFQFILGIPLPGGIFGWMTYL